MHRYNRAYKDANSPLTPLTPLNSDFFDFNIDTERPCCSKRARCESGMQYSDFAAARPRKRAINCTAGKNMRTPNSCESALKKRNNYIRTISALGIECVGTSMPSGRAKRTPIKSESLENIPTIILESPPRSKRRSKVKTCNSDFKCEKLENCLLSVPSSRKMRRQFDPTNIRLSSPVEPKPMSPRFGAFLARWGINCLKSIFERQEIDLQTFCCLNADDLELLGIQDPTSRERVMEAINFVTSAGINWFAQ